MDLDKDSEDQKFEHENLTLNEKEGPIRMNHSSKYVYDKCYDVLVSCYILIF